MFYYLLYNSSFNKNTNLKEKGITTLIYGSVVYIFIHAIISHYFKSKGILKYFWLLLLIDCSAVFLNSDFNGFSTINIINEPNNITEDRNKIVDEYIKKNTPLKEKNLKSNLKSDNNNGNKRVSFNKEIEVLNKDELRNNRGNTIKNKNKNQTSKKSDDINIYNKNPNICDKNPNINDKNSNLHDKNANINDENIKSNNISLNINNLNDNPDFLNLTLENLEKIDDYEVKEGNGSKSNSIQDLQNNFLKKKLEDELSDPGSDLDLAGFEAMVANS
tara:strand:+ start:374 stop:1198 length:825 start_codon:yes stop_codon:yes gene_type:complete